MTKDRCEKITAELVVVEESQLLKSIAEDLQKEDKPMAEILNEKTDNDSGSKDIPSDSDR